MTYGILALRRFVVKKLINMAVTLLYLSLSSVSAGYLQVDSESDIRRVANNVIEFYDSHYEDLISWEAENFSRESLKLEKIRFSACELVADFTNHKKSFFKEFSDTKIYVKNNKILIEERLGQNDYSRFISGLFYIHNLLKIFIN